MASIMGTQSPTSHVLSYKPSGGRGEGGSNTLQEANGDVPLDEVAFS